MKKTLLLSFLFFLFSDCFLNVHSNETKKQSLLNLLYVTNHLLNKRETARVDFFSRDIERLEVHILYQVGFEPITQNANHPTAGELTPWNILESNLFEIFNQRNHPISLSVPKELPQMQTIGDTSKDHWNLYEISDLIHSKADTSNKSGLGKIFIVFLNGNYEENGTRRKNVSGINIIGTPYIAIFPKVIHPLGKQVGNINHIFKEQTTVVHEVGHALGLVNNGIPLTSNHQDKDNGLHCNNQFCVMHWTSNNTASVGKFLSNFIQTGSLILFQEECLLDIRNFAIQHFKALTQNGLLDYIE